MIIDQAPEDGFDNESFAQRLSYWPMIGQAVDRPLQIAPKSTIRGPVRRRLRPRLQHLQRLRQPRPARRRPARDDLHGVQGHVTTPSRTSLIEAPLDERLAAAHVPLLVIFGAEDQIYDAQAAVARYRQTCPACRRT